MNVLACLHTLISQSTPSDVQTASIALDRVKNDNPNSLASDLLSLLSRGEVSENEAATTLSYTLLKNVVCEKWRSKGRRNKYRGNSETSSALAEELLSDNIKLEICKFLVFSLTTRNTAATSSTSICRLVAVTVSKIVRSECLSPTPSQLLAPLLTPLISSISSAPVLLSLSKILKELSTIRLKAQKERFRELSVTLLPPLVELFEKIDPTATTLNIDVDHLVTKCISLILSNNLPTILSSEHSITYCDKFIARVISTTLPSIASTITTSSATATSKMFKWVFKTISETSKNHPIEFSRYSPQFFDFFVRYIDYWGSLTSPTKYEGISSMATTTCCKFFSSIYSNPQPSTLPLLTAETTMKIGTFPILHLLTPLRSKIDYWLSSPEAFYLDYSYGSEVASTTAAVDHGLSKAGEDLWLSCLESEAGKDVLAGFVGKGVGGGMAEQIRAVDSGEDGLERKGEGVWTAVGLGACVFENAIDFGAWFDATLRPCMTLFKSQRHQSQSQPQPHILKQRLIWLLGCHISSYTPEIRPAIYDFVVHMLMKATTADNEIEVVIGLTSVTTLNSLLEDWEFQADDFSCFADEALKSMYTLLGVLEELEHREIVLKTCEVLVVRLGPSLPRVSYSTAVTPLLQIWQASISNNNNILRKHVLSILLSITSNIHESDALELYTVTIPMLDYSLDAENHADDAFLLEEALKLWLTLVRMAPSYNESLHTLFRHLIGIVKQDFEHLKLVTMILEVYIMVGRETFLNAYGAATCEIFLVCAGHVKSKGTSYCLAPLNALLRNFPVAGAGLLLQGGVIRRFCDLGEANSRGDKDCENDFSTVNWLTVLARAGLANDEILALLKNNVVVANLYIDKFEVSGNSKMLWVLFLACLVSANVLLDKLDDVVSIYVDFIKEGENDCFLRRRTSRCLVFGPCQPHFASSNPAFLCSFVSKIVKYRHSIRNTAMTITVKI